MLSISFSSFCSRTLSPGTSPPAGCPSWSHRPPWTVSPTWILWYGHILPYADRGRASRILLSGRIALFSLSLSTGNLVSPYFRKPWAKAVASFCSPHSKWHPRWSGTLMNSMSWPSAQADVLSDFWLCSVQGVADKICHKFSSSPYHSRFSFSSFQCCWGYQSNTWISKPGYLNFDPKHRQIKTASMSYGCRRSWHEQAGPNA